MLINFLAILCLSIYGGKNGFSTVVILGFLLLGLILNILITYLGHKYLTQRQIKKIYQLYPELEYRGKNDLSINRLIKKILILRRRKLNLIENLENRENFTKEYISNVSHEIKTPLFSIQGYLLTLIDGAKDEPKILERYLSRMEKSVEQLVYLTESLNTLSLLENDAPLKVTKFNIVDLTQKIMHNLELKAEKSGVILALDQNHTKEIFVMGDENKIEQVLSNLIENSINHAGECLVEVGFEVKESSTKIRVKDYGVGIPKEDQDRLFDRFYRIEKSRNRKYGGSGLGLAIVKKIIETHGSNIYLKSQVGIGTSFEFDLKNG